MVSLRLVLSALLTAAGIAVPAIVVTLFAGWKFGIVIAIFMALGVGGGRWIVSMRNGGGSASATGGAPRGRARQSKGARGGRRRER